MKYLWHLGVNRFEKIMEKIPDVPTTIEQVHKKFLAERSRMGRKRVVAKRKKTL
jgi:hypothetical protein